MASTVWRGHLSFGLISIPVRLFRAARAERIPLRRAARVRAVDLDHSASLSTDIAPRDEHLTSVARKRISTAEAGLFVQNSPDPEQHLMAVRQSNVDATTGSLIADSAITRAVEFRKNQLVEIPVEELKNLQTTTSAAMAIQEFVVLSEIDPVFFETSYYVVPEEVGEKAYALLYRSLVKTNVVALAEVAMHGRDHIVVVRPGKTGLIAHTMFYSSEVHLDEQFRADRADVSQKELELAEMLIGSLTRNFVSDRYKNGYQEKLRALIAGKVDGEPDERRPMHEQPSGVVDIAEALRRSLAQLKKPTQKSGDGESKVVGIRKMRTMNS